MPSATADHPSLFADQRTIAWTETGDLQGLMVRVQHGMVFGINNLLLCAALAETGWRVTWLAPLRYSLSKPGEIKTVEMTRSSTSPNQ